MIGGDEVYIRTSEKLWGTWSDPVKVYDVSDKHASIDLERYQKRKKEKMIKIL